MDLVDPSTPLPHWFSEEDLTNYARLYEKSGFCTPLQILALLGGSIGLEELKVKVPAFVFMGEKDYPLKIPGLAYSLNKMVRDYISDIETTYLPDRGIIY
ncbi:hypothetical protein GIB67_026497 [Kingdonia uniflora]|uniref:Uncharacterized protein n=1 Tax=Kingdonia uniflora TaxID=39325 RepID=A0A7J7P6D8_9MAGN|nr:hypothetical protein GIB67_026497 [Kingdonia uniflora]